MGFERKKKHSSTEINQQENVDPLKKYRKNVVSTLKPIPDQDKLLQI